MLARAALLRLSSLRPSLQPRQQLRFGSGAGAPKGGGGYGSGEYRGIKVPPVAAWHKNVATIWGTTMWLWIMWRCKNDGKALLVRPPRLPEANPRPACPAWHLRAGNPALGGSSLANLRNAARVRRAWSIRGSTATATGTTTATTELFERAPPGTRVWSRCQINALSRTCVWPPGLTRRQVVFVRSHGCVGRPGRMAARFGQPTQRETACSMQQRRGERH